MNRQSNFHNILINFLLPLFSLTDQRARASEQQLVEDEGGDETDEWDNGDVLGPVGEGRPADSVPLGTVPRGTTLRQAVEVEVALVVVAGAQVRPPLQHLRTWASRRWLLILWSSLYWKLHGLFPVDHGKNLKMPSACDLSHEQGGGDYQHQEVVKHENRIARSLYTVHGNSKCFSVCNPTHKQLLSFRHKRYKWPLGAPSVFRGPPKK